jgi:hypothetical protein
MLLKSIPLILITFISALSHSSLAQKQGTNNIASDSAQVQQEVDRILEFLNEGKPNGKKRFQSGNSKDMEIDGLVIDNTVTKIGKDFYDVFYNNWEAPPDARNFTIVIKELPFRGQNAQVEISINGNIVFEQFIQPRYDAIEEMANYAVAVSYEFIVDDHLRQQLEADGKKQIEQF